MNVRTAQDQYCGIDLSCQVSAGISFTVKGLNPKPYKPCKYVHHLTLDKMEQSVLVTLLV